MRVRVHVCSCFDVMVSAICGNLLTYLLVGAAAAAAAEKKK